MVEMSEVLMERKADYNQSHDKASRGMIKDSVLNHKPLLNGNFDFLGRQQRSSSECSSDSQVDTLLEEADKIQTSKNGFNRKGVKKQVRFNMERNREHCYSYAQSSDDESLMNNVNFMDHNFHHSERYDDENDSGSGDDNDENDDRDSDDDDDDDDDDSQSTDDEEEREGAHNQHDTDLSEENSTLGKFGHLVDKSGPPLEINNTSEESNSILKPTRLLVNGVNDTAEGSLVNGLSGHCEAHMNDELLQNRTLVHLRAKVVEMESSLRAKQDSAQREMEDMSTRLQRERENTTQEMNKLQKELEDRRRQYLTEMQDIDRQREEQKKKFEEELEEFRNEKKLEERRQRYYEHEATISQMEKELDDRAQEVRERDKEIREYEEYLNRRHAVCTNKEQDLNVLQSELEILASELEAKKAKLLNRQQLVHQSSEEDTVPSTPPLLKARSASRMSIVGKGGVDLRIEELKSQNKQLLEELFSLRKACESKDEDLTELREKLGVSESENKRFQQRTKHLETQLELARKTAEIGADSISVDEIMRKTSQDMRKNSRMIRPSRAVAPLSSSGSSSGIKLVRVSSIDSVGTKNTSSSDTEKGTKASDVKAVKLTAGKKGKDDCGGRHKLGTEKITSGLCTVM